MAHVIAQGARGPRGNGVGGPDVYDNLILLCPTCHRDVDKAPKGTFSEALLHKWKNEHEGRIRSIGLEQHFAASADLVQAVNRLLAENYAIWKTVGPKSIIANDDLGSNAHRIWALRRVDRIVPNNRKIINLVSANTHLLSDQQSIAFPIFVVHAESYEEHVYDRVDRYPLFPNEFAEAFK